MPDRLGSVVKAIAAALPGVDGVTAAETIWLAAQADPHWTPVRGDRQPARTGPWDDPMNPAAASESDAAEDEGGRGVYEPAATGAGAPTVRGRRITIPAPAGLPDALAFSRALRPFRRRWPRGRTAEIDLDASVRAFADTGRFIPVMVPASERWFDADILIDSSPSMRLWKSTVGAFTTVLRQSGVFRTVQARSLRVDRPEPTIVDSSGRLASVGLLCSPDARRLVIVVSDCQHPRWYDPALWQMIRRLAMSTPTAILNPLRAAHWRITGMNLPAVRVYGSAVGARNAVLRFDPPQAVTSSGGLSPRWVPVPALELSYRSVGRWSRLLMRRDQRGMSAVLLDAQPHATPHPEVAEDDEFDPTPAQRIRAFELRCTDQAFRLAVLCTPFPRVGVGIVHLLRDALVPGAGVADMAELVVGGLVDLEEDPVGLVLQFKPGVRETLVRRLTSHDAWRSYEILTAYIADRVGAPGRTVAAVRDPYGDLNLAEDLAPFAQASRETLEVLGIGPRPRLTGGYALLVHAAVDRSYALRLAAFLGSAGIPVQRADKDSGAPHDSTVHHLIDRCAAVVLITSTASLRSTLLSTAAGHARAAHRPIHVIRLDGAPLPGFAEVTLDEGRSAMPGASFIEHVRSLTAASRPVERVVPAFPNDPSAPCFFLSYARAYVPKTPEARTSAHRDVLDLFDELSAHVADLIALDVGQEAGFMDRASLVGTQTWENDVMHAVSTCQVFVPLLTASYPRRTWCEREWQIFAGRRAVSKADGRPARNTSVVPVLWTPGGAMPSYIRTVGTFAPKGLPSSYLDHYQENGLYGLARLHPDEFRAVAWKLAMEIRRCWEERWIEPADIDTAVSRGD